MNGKLTIFSAIIFLLLGCAPRVQLFTSATEPLREFVIRGEAKEKILVIPVRGMITDEPEEKLMTVRPSLVEEVVSQLRLAKEDENIRAIVLKIESFGGTVTASDILYHEISRLKEEKKIKVVAVFMNVATSGAYYISLPADSIVAHPTTITGSVGVIFMRPDLTELMDKIGVGVKVNKSGKHKDIGSIFRKTTAEEEKIIQKAVDQMAERFFGLLFKHRNLSPAARDRVLTAQMFLGTEAEKLGLVDRIGYLDDAIEEAKALANLDPDSRVVVYRRNEYANDNLYNSSTMQTPGKGLTLIDLDLIKAGAIPSPGLYYLWLPETHDH